MLPTTFLTAVVVYTTSESVKIHALVGSTIMYESDSTILSNSSDRITSCNIKTPVVVKVQLTVLTTCFILLTATLILILSNRRLRKQQNIFPFNLVLADLLGVFTFLVKDGMSLASGEEELFIEGNQNLHNLSSHII